MSENEISTDLLDVGDEISHLNKITNFSVNFKEEIAI